MNKSKAPLVMLEQMVMLLVFALAAALCLQAFVKSDAASRESEARDRAALLCQSVAEIVRTNNCGTGEAIYLIFGEYLADPLQLREDMTPAADGEEIVYYLDVVPQDYGTPGLLGAIVRVVTPEWEEFFSLDVCWQVEVTQ